MLLRGPTPDEATMVAATADPEVVREFADRLLNGDGRAAHPGSETSDPVEQAVAEGRRKALQVVRDETGDDG